jgi:radical SAM protein with 4Fe4S-binding SPASM domain
MIMDCHSPGEIRITFTNRCNARCTTCLMSKIRHPAKQITWDVLKRVLAEAKALPSIREVSFYSIGESYLHPEFIPMAEWAIAELSGTGIRTTLVTNGSRASAVPRGLDNLYISFNAGRRETYERITGLSFHETVDSILRLYRSGEFRKVSNVEIHMLVFHENRGEVGDLRHLFRQLRGVRLRTSGKLDNQHGELAVQEDGPRRRFPCDYVTHRVTVYPDGEVVLCPHDFEGETRYGNILENPLSAILRGERRKAVLDDHRSMRFSGICRDCNYNTESAGLFRWRYFHPWDQSAENARRVGRRILRAIPTRGT